MEEKNRLSFKGRRGKPRTLTEKFWDYVVVKAEGCWNWSGSLTAYGYAQIMPSRSRRARRMGEEGYSPLRGHRVSWEIHNGPIPDGLNVLHHCDNPICTNPKHLYLGTQSENLKDAWSRGRRKPKRNIVDGKVLCPRGHEKELLPNETDKYVCRVCMNSWHKRNPEKARQHRLNHKKKLEASSRSK